MVLVRRFEEHVADLYRDGEVPGFVHLSIGQEAVAAGVTSALRDDDVITSTHRGHGHCLAKGMAPEPMLAELLGRATGTCHGLGGSMHIADPALGVFGANGIVGAGLPIAVGAALAAHLEGSDRVVVAFFGDGAVAQGAFHEAVNLAALWRLPVVFCCENNHYAEFAATADQHPAPIARRADAYGIEAHRVDGNDVEAVALGAAALVERCRQGDGPFLLEAETERWHGHYEGDPQRYRPEDERDGFEDPVVLQRSRLEAHGVPGERLDAIEADVADRLLGAVEAARAAPPPDLPLLHAAVYAGAVGEADEGPEPDGEPFRYMDGLRDALDRALTDDPRVLVAGVDVARSGGPFGITRGLAERHGERVRDVPISETALLGLGVGAAMAGWRPVIELMYLDFIGVCFDQLLNQAAKLRFMTGGVGSIPLVVRTQFGAGRSSGAQHSQSLEALVAHVPGLRVVMPSTPADAYGLLRSAIACPDPVVVIENRHLYGAKGPRPPLDHVVPIGRAAVRRPGRDLTIVVWSRMAGVALEAAAALAAEGIDAEVVDLRTVSPVDLDTVAESVRRTSRLLVAQEAVEPASVGTTVAAGVADVAFGWLDAPIRIVSAPFTPAPYAPNLEAVWLPDTEAVVDAARSLVAW